MLKKKGIIAIDSVIVLFVILHWVFVPDQHDTRTTFATMLSGIAFLLMTSGIVLSTRLSFFEDWFGGLDRMYQVHKLVGVVSVFFILAHFLAVPKELPIGADPLTESLVPSAPLGMVSMVLLIISLALALNRKISYSRWRPIHRLMGLIYLLVVAHFITAPAIFVEQLSPSGLLLIIAAIVGVVAFFYSVIGMNKRTAVPFKIDAINALERATEVVLKPVDKMLDFKPGQFAFVEIQGKGWNEPHPFTISSAPGEDRLRFTMKVLGDWTRKVREELEPGGEVLVRGPYGRFNPSAAGKKQIWLAGGVGLTPFLSALRAMEKGDDRQIHLVYASRNEEDAIFLQELQERAAELGNVNVIPLFSDVGHFARVDMMKEKLPDPLPTYDHFLCGPKPMVDGITKDLKAEGVPRQAIHTEAFEFR